MKYANGRTAQLRDQVLATGPAGLFIGRLVAMDGANMKVMPAHSQSAFYLLPAAVLLAADALIPAADIKPVA